MTKQVEYRGYDGNYHLIDSITVDDFQHGKNTQATNFAIATQKIAKYKNDIPFYLEIGSSHYKDDSNTYVLENEHGWSGISIDTQENLVKEFNQNRKNLCLNKDAISINWDEYLEAYNAPKRIDFLQIDIDITPPDANLLALINLPLTRYRFNSIVIEHNVGMEYTMEKMRSIQRYILTSMGYRLVQSGHADDWWVDSECYEFMQTIQISSLKLA